MNQHTPIIGLMLGDVTGIGPEIAAKLLASGATSEGARTVVIGDARVLELGMRDAGVKLRHAPYRDIAEVRWPREDVPLVDLGNVDPAKFNRGVSSDESGRLSGETLKIMIDLALAGRLDGICFAPLNKGAMHQGGWKFNDEHQMFARLTDHSGFFGEMNVIEQVVNVSRTTVVREAWARGQQVEVHGVIYSVADGLLQDLHIRTRTEEEVAAKVAEIRQVFEIAQPGRDKISMPVTEEALRWAARVAVGLDRLVADFDLDGLTYYYRGLDGNANEELGASLIVGNSLLTGRGIPAAGEGDLKTCVAMLMMDRMGAGGSYTEFYAMDFVEDFILMGHDGPGHIAISEGKPVLRGLGLYHGKRGYGVSVEFNVKTGPITILGVTQTAEGRLKMLAAEGESLPGPRLEIGNTNSRLRFGLDPAEFMNRWSEEGPTHHCALGVGRQVGKIRKLAQLLEIELAVVG